MSIYSNFAKLVNTNKRLLGDKNSFSWVNDNDDLIQSIQLQCPDLVDVMGLNELKLKSNTVDEVDVVDISDVQDDLKKVSKEVSVDFFCAGGISAKWLALFLSEQNIDIKYIDSPKSHLSSTNGSSLQYHVSHAMPMYADYEFSALKIFYRTILRFILPFLDTPARDNFPIVVVHPKSFLSLKTYKVGLGYFFHEMKYKLRRFLGESSIIDETIPLAIKSGKILSRFLQKYKLKIRVGYDTVRVAYNSNETKEFVELKAILSKYSIQLKRISFDDYYAISGTRLNIGFGGSVWRVVGDGFIPFELFHKLDDLIANKDAHERALIKKIIVENNCLKGIIVKKEDKLFYYRTNKAYLSLGVHSRLRFGKKIKVQERPDDIIQGTGFASFLLIEGDLKVPIDSNNSHFTPVRVINYKNKKYTIMKASSGAVVGSNQFCRDHAINCLYYAEEILFKDLDIIPISFRPCSRPINSQNSGKLSEIIKGLYMGHGFGGKGVTDAPGFIMKHLHKFVDESVADKIRKIYL